MSTTTYVWGDFNEYPQHMFLWRNKQNYLLIITKYPPYLASCQSDVTSKFEAGKTELLGNELILLTNIEMFP